MAYLLCIMEICHIFIVATLITFHIALDSYCCVTGIAENEVQWILHFEVTDITGVCCTITFFCCRMCGFIIICKKS